MVMVATPVPLVMMTVAEPAVVGRVGRREAVDARILHVLDGVFIDVFDHGRLIVVPLHDGRPAFDDDFALAVARSIEIGRQCGGYEEEGKCKQS